MDSTSVHVKDKLPPWWIAYLLFSPYHFFKKYLLDELLPFSLYLGSLVNSPQRIRSAIPRFTVLLDIEVSLAIVFIAGQHSPFASLLSFRYIYTVFARVGSSSDV